MSVKRPGAIRSLRGWCAAVVAIVLVLGGGVSAQAAPGAVPSPDHGTTAGGTTVTVPAPPGVTFTDITAGLFHSLALGSDGNTYAWGHNGAGQLGDGTTTNRTTPVLVQAPAGVTFTDISAGVDYSVALGSDGNTYAWGANASGQLGDGTTTDSATPVLVQTPVGVTFTHIAAGYYHSVALGSDGNTYAWGNNSWGQLGDGTNTYRTTPVLVQAPAGVTFTHITAGQYHSVALGSDGNTYAWGYNDYGQLGDGTTTDSTTPVRVQTPAGVTFTHITAGGSHSVALGSDGNTYAWGLNDYGQLGDGTTTDRTTPVLVQTPAGVTFTDITAGYDHSVALGSDGNAYAWGDNSSGQLGDGTTTDSATPVLVQTPAGVTFTHITAGYDHSVALGSDGNTYAWGYNGWGQLGDGTTTDRATPVEVVLPQVVVDAVKFDGVAGTSLTDNGDGTVSVVTPPHAAGPVDVTVEWSVQGVSQTPVTYAGGFTYVTPVTITDPSDVTVDSGEQATFTVTTAGEDVTVTWEVSTDKGDTWQAVTAGVSADGHTLTVTGNDTVNTNWYRATATTLFEQVVSAPAVLTVNPPAVAEKPEQNPGTNQGGGLAETGGANIVPLAAGAVVLLLGAGALLFFARRHRRTQEDTTVEQL